MRRTATGQDSKPFGQADVSDSMRKDGLDIQNQNKKNGTSTSRPLSKGSVFFLLCKRSNKTSSQLRDANNDELIRATVTGVAARISMFFNNISARGRD